MKKISQAIICVVFMLSFASFSTFAEELSDYIFSYQLLENGEYSISGYEGQSASMVIPSQIDGNKITRISIDAFATNAEEIYYDPDCYCQAESIIIEEGIQLIGFSAFENCKNLISVTLPNSLVQISDYAFQGCENLTSITIPKSVSYINSHALGYTYESSFSPDNWEYETWGEPIKDFTIYGYPGTAAEAYANENGFTFIALSDEQTSTTVTATTTTATSTTTLTETSSVTVNSTTVTTSTTMPTTSTPSSSMTILLDALYGDINSDAKVSLIDIVHLNKHNAEMILLNEQQLRNADCNADGTVNSDDIISLMRFMVQLIDSLPEYVV